MNSSGRVLRRFKSQRSELVAKVIREDKGRIVMEACGGAHYWARRFMEHGFEVEIIATQFVKPYVKSNKNDTIDAEAICEAGSRRRCALYHLAAKRNGISKTFIVFASASLDDLFH